MSEKNKARQNKQPVKGKGKPGGPGRQGAKRRGGYTKKALKQKEAPVVQVEKALVPDVKKLEVGEGVLILINIDTPIDQGSFNFLPVGLVSLAMNRGLIQPYLYYLGDYRDNLSIATGGPGTATNRLRYQNDIKAALAPKTIPFRNDGMIGYKFTDISTSDPPPQLTLDGGLNYYMYEDAGIVLGVWRRQRPPTTPATDQTIDDAYMDAMNKLSGKPKHINLIKNVPLSKRYARDASAYMRNLSYYGQGAGVGSPNNSIELEVPASSKMLGTLQQFDAAIPRSSRFLTYASGDSISNWSIGALPDFFTNYYNSAVTPIYKFLDLTELVHILVTLYIKATTAWFSSIENPTTEQLAQVTGGLGVTYTQFFIGVRQQIVYMFRDSQAIAQGLSFARLNSGFRPFICGSNTYGRKPIEIMNIPLVLNENLRCLKMAIRPYITKNFSSRDNHITHIPVWGTFGGFVPPTYTFTLDGTVIPVFALENSDPNTPNVFDGTSGNFVVDFNTSNPPLLAAEIWNDAMELVQNQIANLTPIGGDSKCGPFLQFTRYAAFTQGNDSEVDVTDMRRIPNYMKNYIVERETDDCLKRTKSKEGLVKKVKKIYAPPGSTLFNEFTTGYSGMVPITDTHLENFNNFILPVIEVSFPMTTIPNTTQVQTACLEPYNITYEGPSTIIGSRVAEIEASVVNYMTGKAGKKTELAEFISALSNNDEGGFLGDLFAAVEPLVNAVPVVGPIAASVGRLVTSGM